MLLSIKMMDDFDLSPLQKSVLKRGWCFFSRPVDERLMNALRAGNYDSFNEFVIASPHDAAKRCRASAQEIDAILDKAGRTLLKPTRLSEDDAFESGVFTTGDSLLDQVLGGGLRTGMVWEVAGERFVIDQTLDENSTDSHRCISSSAGKTQLALQVSLTVQLPLTSGGLGASACYITTSSYLQTSRLSEMLLNSPLVSSENSQGCPPSLERVHTLSANTIAKLVHTLTTLLPGFLLGQRGIDNSEPGCKLLVIDAIAELFHTSSKTTTETLVERSKVLSEISLLLHSLASKFGVAVLILNEVSEVFGESSDAFSSSQPSSSFTSTHSTSSEVEALKYSSQSRWFARAPRPGQPSLGPDMGGKEATLGLQWANQLNARIMLARTGRRRYIDSPAKGSSSNSQTSQDEPALIRHLAVVFSSVGPRASMDYIITVAGFVGLSKEEDEPGRASATSEQAEADLNPVATQGDAIEAARASLSVDNLDPMDVGYAVEADLEDNSDDLDEERVGGLHSSDGPPNEVDPDRAAAEDEWEAYWQNSEISEEMLASIDQNQQ